MRKILYGILAVFMSLSLAYGSGFLIQMNINAASQTETEEEKEEETTVKAYGNWTDTFENTVSGSGTYSDPIRVYDGKSFAKLIIWVRDGYNLKNGIKVADAYVELTSNIDLSAHYWTPIGTSSNPFSGTFNGNGYKITGLNIIETNVDYFASLFGHTKNATIKDVSISGRINITGVNIVEDMLVIAGGVMAISEGTNTKNIISNVSISISTHMVAYVGGIAGGGTNYGSTDNCISKGNISISSVNQGFIGGVVGACLSNHSVGDSFNYGKINATYVTGLSIGGIVGFAKNRTEITGCANFGDLSLNATSNAESTGFGGILGVGEEDGKTYILDCANYGNVIVSGSQNKYIGGIVGHIVNNGLINRCLNFGEVAGGNCVGGIAGEMGVDEVKGGFLGIGHVDAKTNVAIENCVNYGLARGNSNVGGVVGYMNGGKIYKSYYSKNGKGSGNGNGSSGCSYESLTTLYGYNFLNNTSSWYRETFLDYYCTGFDYEINKSTYIYNEWVITPLVSKYLNDTSKINSEFCLVPYYAIGTTNIGVYYRGAWSNYNEDKDGTIATLEKYAYTGSGEKGCEWTAATTFDFLKGVNYSSYSTRTEYLVRVSLDTQQAKNFTFSGFDYGIGTELDDYSSEKFHYICFNDNDSQFFSQIRAKFNSKGSTTRPEFQYYLNGGGRIADDKIDDCGRMSILNTGSLYYKSEVLYKIDTQNGYVLKGIYRGISFNDDTGLASFYSPIMDNSSATFKGKIDYRNIGEAFKNEYKYEYNYEETLYVVYDYLEYKSFVYLADVKDNIEIPKDNIPTQIFNITQKLEIGKEGTTFQNWIEYGYKYDVYTIKEEPPKETINGENYIKLDGDDGLLKKGRKVNEIEGKSYEGKMLSIHGKNIIENSNFDNSANDFDATFNIIIVRTKIEDFKIRLHNKANSFQTPSVYEKEDNTSTSGIGGFSSFAPNESFTIGEEVIGGKKVTTISSLTYDSSLDQPKFGIKIEPHMYYSYFGSSFTDSNSKLSGLLPSSNASSVFEKSFKEFYDAWVNSTRLEENNHTIDIYSYYSLEEYNIQCVVKVDNVNKEDGFTVKCKTSQDEIEGTNFPSNFSSYYFDEVTLSASLVDGYKFVGFFYNSNNGGDKYCLSTNNVYKFTRGSSTDVVEQLGQLNIVVKYASYNQVEASYNVINNKSTYTITSPNDLVWLSNQVEKGETFENCTFVLANDISMSGIKFNPIGSKGIKVLNKKGEEVVPYFAGVFDGNNHIISNLTLCGDIGSDYDSSLNFRGLFGYTNGATIKNLTISDSHFSGYSYVGSVVGYAENTVVENVHNYNCQIITYSMPFYSIYLNIDGTNVTLTEDEIKTGKLISDELFSMNAENIDYVKRNYFGGIAGYATGSVFRGISNRANVGVSGGINVEVANNISGLVGFANGNFKIEQSFFEGKVSGAGSVNNIAGGEASKIENCYYKGSTLIVYNATTINPSSTINEEILSSRYYNNNLEVTLPDKTIKTLDSSIWLIVNRKLTLRYFYWS